MKFCPKCGSENIEHFPQDPKKKKFPNNWWNCNDCKIMFIIMGFHFKKKENKQDDGTEKEKTQRK